MCDDSVHQSITEIYVSTGNLLESEELKRNITVLPGEEIYEGLRLTLESWKLNKLKDVNEHQLGPTSLLILNDKLQIKKPIDQANHKVNIKVCLFSNNKDDLEYAIQFAKDQLSIKEIDSLTLSFAPNTQQTSLDDFKLLWSVLESKAELHEIGVSDLNTSELMDLFNGATKIKPHFNQINLDSCCAVPSEMSDFAKEHNIRLLTHNDPRDVLSKEKVCKLFGCKNVEKNNWQRIFLIRYSILSRNKGIITTKGYILFVKKI